MALFLPYIHQLLGDVMEEQSALNAQIVSQVGGDAAHIDTGHQDTLTQVYVNELIAMF